MLACFVQIDPALVPKIVPVSFVFCVAVVAQRNAMYLARFIRCLDYVMLGKFNWFFSTHRTFSNHGRIRPCMNLNISEKIRYEVTIT